MKSIPSFLLLSLGGILLFGLPDRGYTQEATTHKVAAAQNADTKSELTVRVRDSLTGEWIPYAQVDLRGEAEKMVLFTDSVGACVLALPHGSYEVEAQSLGYATGRSRVQVNADRTLTLRLAPQTENLDEVTIYGRKKLIQPTSTGLQYDMAKDKSVQASHLLNALNRVPLVTVDANDEIRVKGSPSYSIYLNGQPYRIAQLNPKEVLRSIPASTIERIEVITQVTGRYDGDTGDAIINIITRREEFDNWALTLNGGGGTQPNANGGATFLATRKKIDFSLGYSYRLDGQHNQPVDGGSTYKSETIQQQSENHGLTDGYWQKHLVRAMLRWNIDSLSNLYVDGHALIQPLDGDSDWELSFTRQGEDPWRSRLLSNHRNTSGTVESNLIFRRMLRENKRKEHWLAGYRYTYNPDVRHYYQTLTYPDGERFGQKHATNGGLHEHSLTANLLLIHREHHDLEIGGRQTFRDGRSDSETHNLEGSPEGDNPLDIPRARIDYRQNVSAAYAVYSASFGDLSLNASLRWEYSNLRMRFPLAPEANHDYDGHHLLPFVNLSYQRGSSTFATSYAGKVERPGILMLNPFRELISLFKANEGNPDLRDSYTHTWKGSYMYYSNLWFVSAGLTYRRGKRIINNIPSYLPEEAQQVNRYGNIDASREMGTDTYINYRPTSWLSLAFAGDFTWLRLKNGAEGWDKGSPVYNLTFMGDISLRRDWRIGFQYGNYRNAPTVHNKNLAFELYSLSVSKSLLKGALNLRAVANAPFRTFTKIKAEYTLPNYYGFQTNYMRARAFGIDISYTLRSGSPKKLKRDRALLNDDQSTGVD